MNKSLATLGKMVILKAKDSEFFKERKTGFVAKLPGGSEYYGDTQKQAFQFCIKKVGSKYAF